MRRADVLYVGMIVVLVVGLWAIIAAGSDLRAPYDISGTWVLRAEGGQGARQKLRISQSGRFVWMQSESLGSLCLQLPENAVRPAAVAVLALQGERAITIRVPARGSSEHQFQVDGASYIGKRLPPPESGKSGRHG